MPNLFIDIEARFAKFQDSLDKAKKQADGFVAGLTRSLGRVGAIGGGALGFGAVFTGAAIAIKQAADAADELDKVSQKTGVTTEALSELRFAAEINNVTFEELQDGFKKLAVAIDANDDVFRRLDLDPKQFNGLDDALGAVADRFAQIKDPVAAAALAVDLFGKSGNDLLPLLRLGRAGIQEFREEARRLGLTISGDFAKNADAFNDELERMQSAAKGFGIALASSVIPSLTKFLEDLNRGAQLAGGFFDALISLGTINPFKSIDSNVAGYRKSIEEARKDIERLRADLAKPGVVGTPKLAIQSQISSLESGIKRDTTRLKFLQNQQAEDAVSRFSGEQFKDARDLGANDKSFTPGAKKLEKAATARATSPFESLSQSLTSQLQREQKLNEELTLIEDKRFKALSKNQQAYLVGIARQIDALRAEAEARNNLEAGENAAESVDSEVLSRQLADIEARKLAISQAFEDNLSDATAYYSELAVLEDRAATLRIANLQAQGERQQAIASDPARPVNERYAALTRVEAINTQIIAQERELTELQVRNARAISQNSDEQLRRKIEISQQVNQTLGIRNPELDRAALLDQFRDVPEEFKQSVTFKAFINTQLAEQQLAEFERDAGTIEQTLRIKEERITQDVSRGSTSEFTAEGLVSEERVKAASELATIVQRVEEVRAANVSAFGPAQDARLEALRNRLRELNAVTDDHANALRDIGQDAFADFFSDIARGGEDAIGVFDRLGEAIERNLTNRIGQGLSDQLFAEIGQALPGGEGSGLSGALSSGAGAIGDFLGFRPKQKQGAGLGETETTDAINAAADAGAAEFGNLSNSVLDSQIAVDGLTAALTGATPDVESSLVEFGTSAITAQLGAQSLGTVLPTATAGASALVIANESAAVSTTSLSVALQLAAAAANEAAIQFAIAGATASAGGAGFADGGVFVGGVQAFASGGIVGAPTTFPMAGGKIGLMGEAGPEAIMPLAKRSGAFNVHAVKDDGTEAFLSVTRNSAGKLAVRFPVSPATKPFADGGVFSGGLETYAMRFADGAVLSAAAQRFSTLPFRAYANGGIARTPQIGLFGERPEAFVPLPDGKSIPVTMDAMQSSGVTLIQNISTQDANSFRRSRASIYNEANAGLSAASSRA